MIKIFCSKLKPSPKPLSTSFLLRTHPFLLFLPSHPIFKNPLTVAISMSGITTWSQVSKLLPCALVFLLCLALLAANFYFGQKYGPETNSVSLKLSSFTIKLASQNITNDGDHKLVESWTADAVFINHKPHVEITILPFEAFLLLNGNLLACGLMNETLNIGPAQAKSCEINYITDCCKLRQEFEKCTPPPPPSPSSLNITSYNNTRVNMGLMSKIQAHYIHRFLGWNVRMKPYCDNLNVEFDGEGEGILAMRNGTMDCKVLPSPSWY